MIFFIIRQDPVTIIRGGHMLVQLARTLILFVLIICAVRLMGKRTVGELQASELVVTMMLANLAAVPMQEIEIPLISGIVSICALVSMELILSALMLKSTRIAKLISGEPVVIIRHGKIDQNALKKLRMTNADLFEELRKDGIFDINEVIYSVVETDGTVSVLKRSSAEPLKASDTNAKPKENCIVVPVISDGYIDGKALEMAGWDRIKLMNAVKKSGLPTERIFLLTASQDGSYNIIEKENKI